MIRHITEGFKTCHNNNNSNNNNNNNNHAENVR